MKTQERKPSKIVKSVFDKRATRHRKIAYLKPDKTELMGCSFRRLIANLKRNSYSASILRTEEV